ncbi:hypothetical protein ACLBX9_12815 [Methylobacterium sp. A49B]
MQPQLIAFSACCPVDMSEPTRDELVAMARRTFGDAAAQELADHLAVSSETYGVGGDRTNGEG